ncbi:MAG: 16S rRNA (cytosine(1402)-N(4))-methyltransferase [Rhodopirellula sp.]|nr:16S rRNA (cytosine(1402)-N(4))-methyltransferase [Rhodopirellula sp.]|tara:strand:- start:2722 stop:3603 length:882 start_codon:yes stop_codon:yes gene_type:complete
MSSEETVHISVMPDETIESLAIKAGSTILDGTLGGGGHTSLAAKLVGSDGLVIGLDRDADAITRCESSLKGLPVVLAQSNFADAPEILQQLNITKVDAILLDLGLSSDQLEDRERGFSFNSDGPLDLRFDKHSGEPAYRLVQRLKQEHLANLIYEFGEERLSRKIARRLIAMRNRTKLVSAKDIAGVIYGCYPNPRKQKIHPATRTFQALRIAVNQELKSLEIALRRLPEYLRVGGIFSIISFHSLEDRRVKQAFRDDTRLEVLTKKPLTASDAELNRNPRSRSAKLRVARRL